MIHNYFVYDTHDVLEWKPDNVEKFRFTNIKQKGAKTCWSQDGLDFYISKLKEEIEFRKDMKNKYKKIEERPDYFYYHEQEQMVEETKRKDQDSYEFDGDNDSKSKDDESKAQ